MTLKTLNYGNYGIFLIMGNAGFCPSTVSLQATLQGALKGTLEGNPHYVTETMASRELITLGA